MQNFFTQMKHKFGLLDPSEEQKFLQNEAKQLEAAQCKQCHEYRDWVLANSPTVRFLQQEVNKIGGNINENNIVCAQCDDMKSGGFNQQLGILLCQDKLGSRRHLEDTLAHELVHAYDYCRFDVDFLNLKHHACSEIRASTLSGECSMLNEFFRLNFKANRGLQACARRRAILSVKSNPNCKDEAQATAAVNAVFEHCFNDTRPFDEVYR